MAFLLALFPILLILFLMVGLRWGAARSGAAGYLAALVIAAAYFGAGIEVLGFAHTRALLLALDVLLIIWAAFLLYRVVDEAGAIATLGQALPRLTADRGMQALVIGWVFATFLQGVGGFGVPVAVVAPVLIGLNFSPLAAVIIPSVGHGWAVTFGSLGSSFNALMAATGLPAAFLAGPAAWFLGLSGLLSGFLVAHAAGGWGALRRLWLAVMLLGVVMGATQYLVAAVAGLWTIAAFVAGLAGLALSLPLARAYRGDSQTTPGAPAYTTRALILALAGYVILVAIILLVQLSPAVRQALNGIHLQAEFPQVSTALGYVTPAGAGRDIPLLRHTGALLAYASLLTFALYQATGQYRAGAARRIVNTTVKKVLASSISIASMVTMAVIMENAGMTDTLARGLALGVGRAFPAVAPWIGALGAFMTGSNTNSNVVFSALQLRTAELLGFSVAYILAGQTAGAGLASVMAPTKIVVGASTAGMAGQEGLILRRLLAYTGLLVGFISLLTVLAVWLL